MLQLGFGTWTFVDDANGIFKDEEYSGQIELHTIILGFICWR